MTRDTATARLTVTGVVIAVLAALAGTAGADAQVLGRVYHVDVNNAACSDSGPGTEAAPLCTVRRAAAVVVAGDTVLVHAGRYGHGPFDFTRSGTATAPITYRAVGNVVLGNFVDVDDNQARPVPGMANVYSIPVPTTLTSSGVYQTFFNPILVDDPNPSIFTMVDTDGPLRLSGGVSDANLVARAGTARLEAANGRLLVHPYGNRVPGSARTDLVVARGGNSHQVSADYNVFDGFRITYSGGFTLRTTGSNNKWLNLKFQGLGFWMEGSNNSADTISATHAIERGPEWLWYEAGSGSPGAVRGSNHVLKNLHLWHSWNSSLSVEDANNTVVDGLRAHGSPNHCGAFLGGLDVTHNPDNSVLRNFVAYNCQDYWLTTNTKRLTIAQMTVPGGILVRSARDNPVTGPVIVRNSIWGGGFNFNRYENEPLTPDLCQWESGSLMEYSILSTNAKIRHCADLVEYPIVEYMSKCASGQLTGCMTLRNNRLVSDWTTVINGGMWGPAKGDSWTPTLVPGSPAIDTGIVTGTTVDIRGVSRPQGSAYDRGAYEFCPSGC